jgi:urease accessory protein
MMVDTVEPAALLGLLQLADSAVPVGSAAHSFGLETLCEEAILEPGNIHQFLRNFLEETAQMEAVFVRRAWPRKNWRALNDELSARKPARESREASLTLGRRLAELVNVWIGATVVDPGLHYSVAFGAAGAALGVLEEASVLAYLQQSVTAMVSCFQRLMPLGQTAASTMIWDLRGAIARAAGAALTIDEEVTCFSPLPELASMRHRTLETRLFIS